MKDKKQCNQAVINAVTVAAIFTILNGISFGVVNLNRVLFTPKI